MTFEEIELLQTPEARQIIEENLDTAPSDFALRYRKPALASQLKYLQRSKAKLPTFFRARAIVPPLAYEQCSSETAAALKDLQGGTCLDLTCGLGVDTLAFSQRFSTVTAIEQNAVLAATVRYNFSLLGVHNVTVLHQTAEDFLATYNGAPFDWIYLDPARRDGVGKRIFLPEDCEPNAIALMPLLQKHGKQIYLKLSPMYDLDAAQRQFPAATEIGVLSIQNECKEVWIKIAGEHSNMTEPTFKVKCQVGDSFVDFQKKPIGTVFSGIFSENYLLDPDVAFHKGRMLSALFSGYFPDLPGALTSSDGFFLAETVPDAFPGRVFRIIEKMAYQPKKIGPMLKEKKISQINIVQRNFPHTVAQIREALRIKEGGSLFLIATLCNGERTVFLVEKIHEFSMGKENS